MSVEAFVISGLVQEGNLKKAFQSAVTKTRNEGIYNFY